MWFVFPRVAGLGSSGMSREYAITSIEEARAFLEHPVLGADYIEIVAAVREQVVDHGVTLLDLFGKPDDCKIVSPLTLFEGIAARHRPELVRFADDAEAILAAANAEGLSRCPFTERFLREDGIGPD